MSGVATLKIRGTKRHFDEMAVDFPVQPQACSPARFRPPPLKRGRTNPTPATSAPPSRAAFRVPSHPLVPVVAAAATSPNAAAAAASGSGASPHPGSASVAASASPTAQQSAGPSANATTAAASHAQAAAAEEEEEEEVTASSPPPHAPARPLTTAELSCLARFVPRRLKRVVERVAAGLAGPSDRLFSASDLRDAVAAAVAERDAKLSAQFASVLQDRLAEQFRDFTKFNEDYVTRQLRGRETTYLS